MQNNFASSTISKSTIAESTLSESADSAMLPAALRFWRPRHGLIAAAILLFLGVLAFAIWRPIQVLPRMGAAPTFAFQDQDGQELTSSDLRGQFVLYNFAYTSCETPCQQMGAAMQQMQQRLQEVDTGGIPIQFVTISFDPARDTPAQLRAYATGLGADLRNWHFVTGAPDQLKSVIGGGFGVYYAPATEINDNAVKDNAATGNAINADFDFKPTFALVDGLGILRAQYRTATPDMDIVARDIDLLATEVRNSQGAARYAYETAHLFLCFPK